MTERAPSIVVSDHALLRWPERAAGLDVPSLRTAIAESADVGRIHGSRIVVVGAVKLVLSSNLLRVVTVLEYGQPHSDFVDPVELDRRIVLVRRPKRRRRR